MHSILVPAGPTSTDWLSAYSTLFAAVGTVGTLGLGLLLWWQEKQREHRSQARHVNGHAAPTPSTHKFRAEYVVVNRSDGPIYLVHLPRDNGAVLQLSSMVPAGEPHRHPVDNPEDVEKLGLADGSVSAAPFTFSFTDQNNTRWTRFHDGSLKKTPKAP